MSLVQVKILRSKCKQLTKYRNRFSPGPAVVNGVGVQVSVQRVVDQVKMEVCGNAF